MIFWFLPCNVFARQASNRSALFSVRGFQNMYSSNPVRRLVLACAIICAATLPFLFRSVKLQSIGQRSMTSAAAPTASISVGEGTGRATRLLPLARQLTSETLSHLARRYGLDAEAVANARKRIEAVVEVKLDEDLGELAEFDDDEPTIVKIGEGYAQELKSDDETVVLLAHELTHAAAAGNDLRDLVEKVAAEVGRRTDIYTTESQKEDLLCEYVGEQALKRFTRIQTGDATPSERIGRVFGADTQDGDDADDEEHLSPAETWRALRSLDGDLK